MESDHPARVRAVLVIFAFALLLRILPSGYGLPYTFHYDEGRYVSQAVRVAEDGLRPPGYQYGPLFPYLLAGVYGGLYLGGNLLGSYSGPEDFRALYFTDPSIFFRAGRWLAALFGALAVVILGMAARHWRRTADTPTPPPNPFLEPLSKRPGIASWTAMAGLAVLPVAVDFGAQAKAESLGLLLVAIWLYAAGRHRLSSSGTILFLGGVALGLAGAAKMNAFFFLPWHFLIPLVGRRYREATVWVLAALGPVVGFLAGAPTVMLEPGALLAAIRLNAVVSGVAGPDPLVALRDLAAFLGNPTVSGPGPALGALGILGSVSLLARAGRGGVWLCTLTWGYLAFHVFTAGAAVPRYILFGMPAFLLCAGHGAAVLARTLFRRSGAPPNIPRIAMVLAVVLTPLVVSTDLVWRYGREDTRTAAKRWIQENVPAGKAILLECTVASPPLNPDEGSVSADPRGERRASALSRRGEPVYRLSWLPTAWGMASNKEAAALRAEGTTLPGFSAEERAALQLDAWKEQGVHYVVISSFVYGRHLREGADSIPAYRSFYEEVFASGEAVHREVPGDGSRPGPEIRIYRLGPSLPAHDE